MNIKIIALFTVVPIVFLSGCNLPQNQNVSADNSPAQPTKIGTTEESRTTVPEAPIAAENTPAKPPGGELPPEPDLPAPPLVEYVIPQNLINPLQAGDPFTITYIQMIGITIGWAIAESGNDGDHILHTMDGGITWRDITPAEASPAGSSSGKSAVTHFLDAETAWVAYYNLGGASIPEQPVVWRTTDGGKSWTPSVVFQGMEAASFFAPIALWFDASGVGWFLVEVDAGMSKSYAYLFQSLDGGYQWDILVSPTHQPEGSDGIQACGKSELVFADLLNGWLLRDCSGLFPFSFIDKTVDGGTRWRMIELPAVPDEFAADNGFCTPFDLTVFTVDSLKLGLHCQDFTADEPANFYYLISTDDGGEQWDIYDLPSRDATFLNEELGWSIGREIYQSMDGGRTWNFVKKVIWDGQFSIADANNWWAVARDGVNIELVHTMDGGASWEIISPAIGN